MLTEFIQNYWQPTLYTLLSLIVAHSFRKIRFTTLKWCDRQDILESGVLALLHDRLFQACAHSLAVGEITIEELHNLEHLYSNYHGLGGNGVGTELFERCKSLPIKMPS